MFLNVAVVHTRPFQRETYAENPGGDGGPWLHRSPEAQTFFGPVEYAFSGLANAPGNLDPAHDVPFQCRTAGCLAPSPNAHASFGPVAVSPIRFLKWRSARSLATCQPEPGVAAASGRALETAPSATAHVAPTTTVARQIEVMRRLLPETCSRMMPANENAVSR